MLLCFFSHISPLVISISFYLKEIKTSMNSKCAINIQICKIKKTEMVSRQKLVTSVLFSFEIETRAAL